MLVCTEVTAGELAKYFSKVKASAEAQAHHKLPFHLRISKDHPSQVLPQNQQVSECKTTPSSLEIHL